MEKNTELNYGRHITSAWANNFLNDSQAENLKVLDVGCGLGGDLINIKNKSKKNLNLFGIEVYSEYTKTSREKGINVEMINIEKDKFPFEDSYFDLIIINQVLEHTKEIFFIISELNRVLKKDGHLIVGVPNLAAFHNRILLSIGKQPACIKTESAHVRGYTKKALINFVEKRGFKLSHFSGSNFYPFPRKIAMTLAKIFPTMAVCIFFDFKKIKENKTTEPTGDKHLETNYKF